MITLRKYLPLTIVAGAFAILTINIQAQELRALSKEWLINLPSTPLNLSLPSKVNSVRLDSRSTGNIIGFHLGCIAQEKDKFTVVGILEERRINLPGAYGEGDIDPTIIFMPISEFENYKVRCETTNAKVGVVEVEFSDGSIWKAKR
jgi:hypothetical protein